MTTIQISSSNWQNPYFMEIDLDGLEVAAAISKELFKLKSGKDDHFKKNILRNPQQ